MDTHATGSFKVVRWEETPIQQLNARTRLSRATVSQDFSGGIEGSGTVEYLMTHRSDKTATFVGMQHISGRIGGRYGSFVLEVIGTFDGASAKGTWSVVPRSGTNDLRELSGIGGFEAPTGPEGTFALDCQFSQAA